MPAAWARRTTAFADAFTRASSDLAPNSRCCVLARSGSPGHCYLGDRNGTDDGPFDVAPARCPDLQGLPPTFISVGGADGFRDEDIDYALRLYQAAVAWAKCASDE